MKTSTTAIISGICLGGTLYYSWRWYQGLRRIRALHLTNEDLTYSDWSDEDLVSHHLIDLNTADAQQITDLGMSAESLERLLILSRHRHGSFENVINNQLVSERSSVHS